MQGTHQPDVVVMAITSQLRASSGIGELWIRDWQGAGLLKASAVKPVFATLEQRLVIRTLGRFGGADRQDLKRAISEKLG